MGKARGPELRHGKHPNLSGRKVSPYADGDSLNSQASSAHQDLSQLLFFGLSGLTFCSPCSVPSPVLIKKFSDTSKAFMDIMVAQANSGSSSALRWVSLLIPESRGSKCGPLLPWGWFRHPMGPQAAFGAVPGLVSP